MKILIYGAKVRVGGVGVIFIKDLVPYCVSGDHLVTWLLGSTLFSIISRCRFFPCLDCSNANLPLNLNGVVTEVLVIKI